jgi:hypothetical protein
MSETIFKRSVNDADTAVAEYRNLSGFAVSGLALGVLSIAAVIDPMVWCVPFAGVLVSFFALVRIQRNVQALSGRKAALWGLWLSLFFAAAAPGEWWASRYFMRCEAEKLASQWFDYLISGQPEKAFQLTVDSKERQPLDASLWEYYRNSPSEWNALYRFIAPPKEDESPRLVHTLLALNKSAKVRYYDTLYHSTEGANDYMFLRYTVTYEDAGSKKSFFAIVRCIRHKAEDGRISWRILDR